MAELCVVGEPSYQDFLEEIGIFGHGSFSSGNMSQIEKTKDSDIITVVSYL